MEGGLHLTLESNLIVLISFFLIKLATFYNRVTHVAEIQGDPVSEGKVLYL